VSVDRPQLRQPWTYLWFRRKIWQMLGGEGHRSRLVRLLDFALMALICVNCVFSMLESVERLAVVHGQKFHDFDVISVVIFSVEYCLRLWTIVEDGKYADPLWGRLRYVITPLAIVDLLAVLPYYLGFIVTFDLRELRVLRLLRVFKLSRYSSAMGIMNAVLRQEARSMGTVMFVFLVILVFISSVMYLLEHPVQPEVFSDVPTALWWGVETMTTLGYGDMIPKTPLGKLLGGLTALLGVGMIALPAGIMASGFTEQMRLRREDFEQDVEKLSRRTGELTPRQRRGLEEARIALGLSHEEAAHIVSNARKGAGLRCPHCGEPIAKSGESLR
jgi:voltage-gated potassium channel